MKYSNLLHRNNRRVHRALRSHYSVASNTENRRRVVVTGCGIVSPVGCSIPTAWENILQGFCGIRKLDDTYSTLPCRIAAKIVEDDLKLVEHFTKSDLRTLAPATTYALIAG